MTDECTFESRSERKYPKILDCVCLLQHLLLQSMILGKEVTEKSFVNSGSSITFTFNILFFYNVWLDCWPEVSYLDHSILMFGSLTLTTLRGIFFVAACSLSSCGLKLTQAGHLTFSLHPDPLVSSCSQPN